MSGVSSPSIILDGHDKQGAGSLDAVAVKAIVGVFKAWHTPAPESAKLAGVSERTWSRMRAQQWIGNLTEDQRVRASAIVGLFKGLHLYFGDDLADRWPRMRNKGPLFHGDTPVEYMIHGGIPAMLAAREYVDAIRGGV
jgi:hypothetical protein